MKRANLNEAGEDVATVAMIAAKQIVNLRECSLRVPCFGGEAHCTEKLRSFRQCLLLKNGSSSGLIPAILTDTYLTGDAVMALIPKINSPQFLKGDVMAKKKTRSGFNMAEETRNLLKENRKLSGPEVYAALKKKFPKQKINENSCSVAFSGARKKLGIKGRRRKAGAKSTVMKKRPAKTTVNIEALQAAAKYVAQVGDADKAIAAVRQVSSLQIK